MLIGTIETTMDDKGRLVLSEKWRAELASGAVITRGFDKCLCIYPQDRFKKITLEVEKQSVAISVVRAFARHVATLAEYTEPDKRGRINIPLNLCRFAELSNQVTIIGVINCLEIWNPKIFAEFNSQSEEEVKSVAEAYAEKLHQLSGKIE